MEVLGNIFTNDLELAVLLSYPILNKMDDNLQENMRGRRTGQMKVHTNKGQVKHLGKIIGLMGTKLSGKGSMNF